MMNPRNGAMAAASEQVRANIRELNCEINGYRRTPTPQGKAALEQRFDRTVAARTGCQTVGDPLDRMRPHVTRRKISAATRPEAGRDTFLGLMQICMKPGTSFRDDLGHRLHVPDTARVPYPPPDLVRQELAVP